MMKKISILLGAFAVSSKADLASDMLHAHNTVRGSLGIPDLSWSNDLAESSQRYAEKLAASDSLVHSHTDGVGENLAGGTAGSYTPTRLFQLWINEEENFIPGRDYPDCSNGGTVGHYTQVVWERTTEVGCGFAVGPRKAKLVCQYRRPGNVRGQPVYTGNGASNHSNNEEDPDDNNGYNEEEEDNNYNNHNSDNNDNRYDNYNNNSNRYDDNNSREDSGDNSNNRYDDNNNNNRNNNNYGEDSNDNNYNYNDNNNNYNNNGGGGGSQGSHNGGGGGRNGGGGGRI